MPRFACIDASSNFALPEKFRDYASKPPDLPHKGLRWLPANPASQPPFNTLTEALVGPTYTVGATEVTESWSIRAKTAPEIDAEKGAAVNGIDTSLYQAQLKIILTLANDIRELRAKVNTVIDATGTAVPQFPAGQATQITMTQLKTAIKALL